MASFEQHHLAQGHVLTLHDRCGWILRVRVGRIWLTRSSDPEDYFLAAGEAMRLGSGRVVVEADTHPAAHFDIQSEGARSEDPWFASDGVPNVP